MSKVKELAGALIACGQSPFAEADRAALEAFGEDRLVEITAKLAAAAAPPPAAPPEKPLSDEEWMAKAPASVRAMHARVEREEKEKRDGLIKSLASMQKEFTAEQLAAKPTEELQSLSRLLGKEPAAVYAGVAFPLEPETLAAHEPPDSYGRVALEQRGLFHRADAKEN